jgi:hypothetical protein
MVTDLDAYLTRIRDYRTRAYFSDALRCFRAGAFRSAVAATWVTVAYDLIAKYRELSTLGDAEAQKFILDWDRARATNQTSRLLELERTLLTHAHEKMAIIDAITVRAMTRLYEDRHLCAHPAFATQDDLYEPPADLVRAHMSSAVDALLSQQPVQGRGIFEAFSADIQSAGFPSTPQLVADYVEQKYLRKMRPNIVRNFGIVLAKSVVRNIPSEWAAERGKVLLSLFTLQSRAIVTWPDLEAEIVRLIDDDEPGSRPRAIMTLSQFPHLVSRLAQPALIALRQTCASADAVRNSPEVFAASEVAEFRETLIARFVALEDGDAASVLSAAAPHALWPSALERFAQAGSFRGAEARFDQFVAPFVPVLTDDDLSAVIRAIGDNSQIWDAAGIPSRLTTLLRAVAPRRPSEDAASELYRGISRWSRKSYEDVWGHMEQAGWGRPAVKQVENEDPFA